MDSLATYLVAKEALKEAEENIFTWEDSGNCSPRRKCDSVITEKLKAAGCVDAGWRESAYTSEYYGKVIGPGERRAEYEKIIRRAEYDFGLGDVSIPEFFFQGPGSDGERYEKFLLRKGYKKTSRSYDMVGAYVVYSNPHPDPGALRFVRWLRD